MSQHTPDAVADVGFDGNVDYELLLAQRPDLVLLFGVSGASGMEPKLREMGIPFVYIGEYLEESPLGKAEWLVAVSEITDSRQKAKPFSPRFPNATMRSKNGSPQPRPRSEGDDQHALCRIVVHGLDRKLRRTADRRRGRGLHLQEEYVEPFPADRPRGSLPAHRTGRYVAQCGRRVVARRTEIAIPEIRRNAVRAGPAPSTTATSGSTPREATTTGNRASYAPMSSCTT